MKVKMEVKLVMKLKKRLTRLAVCRVFSLDLTRFQGSAAASPRADPEKSDRAESKSPLASLRSEAVPIHSGRSRDRGASESAGNRVGLKKSGETALLRGEDFSPPTDERIRRAILRSETISGSDFIAPRADRTRVKRDDRPKNPEQEGFKRSDSTDNDRQTGRVMPKLPQAKSSRKFTLPKVPISALPYINTPLNKVHLETFVDVR